MARGVAYLYTGSLPTLLEIFHNYKQKWQEHQLEVVRDRVKKYYPSIDANDLWNKMVDHSTDLLCSNLNDLDIRGIAVVYPVPSAIYIRLFLGENYPSFIPEEHQDKFLDQSTELNAVLDANYDVVTKLYRVIPAPKLDDSLSESRKSWYLQKWHRDISFWKKVCAAQSACSYGLRYDFEDITTFGYIIKQLYKGNE